MFALQIVVSYTLPYSLSSLGTLHFSEMTSLVGFYWSVPKVQVVVYGVVAPMHLDMPCLTGPFLESC